MIRQRGARCDNDNPITDINSIAIVMLEVVFIGELDVVPNLRMLIDNYPIEHAVFTDMEMGGKRRALMTRRSVKRIAEEHAIANHCTLLNAGTHANNAV